MVKRLSLAAQSNGGDRLPAVYVSQLEDGRVVLGTGGPLECQDVAWTWSRPLPLANAVTCPVAAVGRDPVPSRHEHVRCAVVVQLCVGDSVLLTRRCAHMRIFPRAWVCPGGGVDAGESLVDAAVREFREEVGVTLTPAALQPVALWESCFPTTPEECRAEGLIKSHHLIVFFEAQWPLGAETPALSLQPEETDAALWLPFDLLWSFFWRGQRREDDKRADCPDVALPLCSGTGHELEARLPLADVAQCYPSPDGLLNGCGEGHMFALQELDRKSVV